VGTDDATPDVVVGHGARVCTRHASRLRVINDRYAAATSARVAEWQTRSGELAAICQHVVQSPWRAAVVASAIGILRSVGNRANVAACAFPARSRSSH